MVLHAAHAVRYNEAALILVPSCIIIIYNYTCSVNATMTERLFTVYKVILIILSEVYKQGLNSVCIIATMSFIYTGKWHACT